MSRPSRSRTTVSRSVWYLRGQEDNMADMKLVQVQGAQEQACSTCVASGSLLCLCCWERQIGCGKIGLLLVNKFNCPVKWNNWHCWFCYFHGNGAAWAFRTVIVIWRRSFLDVSVEAAVWQLWLTRVILSMIRVSAKWCLFHLLIRLVHWMLSPVGPTVQTIN